MKNIIKIVLFLFVLNFFCFLLPNNSVKAAGAKLFLRPAGGTFNLGDTFNVDVVVDSGGGDGVNASDAVVVFDAEYLLVKKVSKNTSIFNLWTSEPTFSNQNGNASYSGGSPSAYKGNAGVIMSISFMSLKEGETEVSFSSGSVLAADGKGTNILSGTSGGKYTFKKKEATEEPKKEEPKKEEPKKEEKSSGILPPPPKIKSATHPEEEVWYPNNNPEFDWKLLIDVSGVSFNISKSSTTDPGAKSEGIIENKKFEKVKEGENYFSIKFQNKYGWGPIAHRKVLIDITPPLDFGIIIDNGGDPTDPSPASSFSTIDEVSGVEKYTVILDGVNSDISAVELGKNPYKFPTLKPGQHKISVIAVDHAGNQASSSKEFFVDALKPPVITEMPKAIYKGDELVIQGTSFYPNAIIKIFISKDGEEKLIELETKTDEDGNWTYFQKNELGKGLYRVWAKVIDHRGAESHDSLKKSLLVETPSIICSYGLWIILFLLLLIATLIVAILYFNKLHKEQNERAMKESRELEKRLSEIFVALKEEVGELMEFVDRKPGVSEGEMRARDKIYEALDISQEFISKEIKDVKKEIE